MKWKAGAGAIVLIVAAIGCGKNKASVERAHAEVARPSALVSEDKPAAYTAVVAPAPLVIPAGTPVAVRTSSTLSTKTNRAGERFVGTLAEPLVIGGITVASRGARVNGLIVTSNRGGRIKGRAQLAVRLTAIQLAKRGMVPVRTSVVAFEARGTKKRDAAKVGIGSGAGAGIGALVARGTGAAIGAAAGAGAGVGYVLATHGAPAVIPAESLLRFRLRNSVRATKS